LLYNSSQNKYSLETRDGEKLSTSGGGVINTRCSSVALQVDKHN